MNYFRNVEQSAHIRPIAEINQPYHLHYAHFHKIGFMRKAFTYAVNQITDSTSKYCARS